MLALHLSRDSSSPVFIPCSNCALQDTYQGVWEHCSSVRRNRQFSLQKVTPRLLVKYAITSKFSATVRLCSPSSFSRSFRVVDSCVLQDHPVRAVTELRYVQPLYTNAYRNHLIQFRVFKKKKNKNKTPNRTTICMFCT